MNIEKRYKRMGLWVDHAKGYFIDLSKGIVVVETVYSNKGPEVRYMDGTGNNTLLGNNNENYVNNRELGLKHEYYNILRNRIKNYDQILIFGPTGAKDELYNILSADKQFVYKTIQVEAADKLTEHQMVAHVKHYFGA